MRPVQEHIDGYRIERTLGTGGYATIYLARDERTGRQVVIKWPDEAMLGDQSVYEHFRREMAVTRRLRHPNIQGAVDDGANRSAPYLVLEYIEGQTLHHLIRERGRLGVEEAVCITRQIAAALVYLHSQGVYHRDLKPGNVLITPEARAKVIDFGMALMRGARRMTWQYLTNAGGTPSYMAPEQIQGKRGDARTDIYALGITLYEMLQGRPPYGRTADDSLVVMQEQLSGHADPLPADVPPGLAGIVRRCIRRDPDERYQMVTELLQDLDRYEELSAADFKFGPEREERLPNTDRRILLLAGIMALTFIMIIAAILGTVILVEHLR